RALDEAVRQVVTVAISDQVDAVTRAAQARAVKALLARARSYVKRYRIVEEKEASGLYSLRIEAEVDDAALRRTTEKWAATGAGARPGAGVGQLPADGQGGLGARRAIAGGRDHVAAQLRRSRGRRAGRLSGARGRGDRAAPAAQRRRGRRRRRSALGDPGRRR